MTQHENIQGYKMKQIKMVMMVQVMVKASIIPGGPKKRPELSHGIMQQTR